MAAGTVTARMHVVQVQFGGENPRLHASVVREMEDTNGEKATMGMCEVEFDIDPAVVQPLVDLAKAQLKKVSEDPKGDPRATQFKDLTIG